MDNNIKFNLNRAFETIEKGFNACKTYPELLYFCYKINNIVASSYNSSLERIEKEEKEERHILE